MTPSAFRSLRGNGSHRLPPKSLYNTLALALPPSDAMYAQILVTMGSSAPCTIAPPVRRWPLVTLPIIVWRPNVISVINGNTLMRYATFRSAEDAITWATWSITVLLTHLMNQMLDQLMGESTRMMTTSIPLWRTTRRVRYVEPGSRIYEGGNVMIFFLSHVFFLISIVRHPYFHFAPLHEEMDAYLLVFLLHSDPFIVPL